jgi:hypothetical protein
MTTLKAEALVREFHYNGIRIPDPGPDLTVEQVRDLLDPQLPGDRHGVGVRPRSDRLGVALHVQPRDWHEGLSDAIESDDSGRPRWRCSQRRRALRLRSRAKCS